MKKYTIELDRTDHGHVTIEAESEAEARAKYEEQAEDGTIQDEFIFDEVETTVAGVHEEVL